jgi:hypothetical protein
MWHRIPIPDLLIAETALHHDLGVVHVDGDFERIAEVRPLVVRRLGGSLRSRREEGEGRRDDLSSSCSPLAPSGRVRPPP